MYSLIRTLIWASRSSYPKLRGILAVFNYHVTGSHIANLVCRLTYFPNQTMPRSVPALHFHQKCHFHTRHSCNSISINVHFGCIHGQAGAPHCQFGMVLHYHRFTFLKWNKLQWKAQYWLLTSGKIKASVISCKFVYYPNKLVLYIAWIIALTRATFDTGRRTILLPSVDSTGSLAVIALGAATTKLAVPTRAIKKSTEFMANDYCITCE